MVWPYIYGCNAHRGAEGDNSVGQFGESRKKLKTPKRCTAVVKHTPYNAHAMAMTSARPFPATQETSSCRRLFYEEGNRKEQAKWNVRVSPEMNAMHELSRGKLPSKRLSFHFPDLFPEIKEQDKASSSKIFYVEPPRLVEPGSLTKWMVPSVPWRYLISPYPPPCSLPSKPERLPSTPNNSCSEDKPRERPRIEAVRTPETERKDAGCQTTHDVGVQSAPRMDFVEDHPAAVDTNEKKEVVLLQAPPPLSPQTTLINASTQTESACLKTPRISSGNAKKEKSKEIKPRRRRRARNVSFFTKGLLTEETRGGHTAATNVDTAALPSRHVSQASKIRESESDKRIRERITDSSIPGSIPIDGHQPLQLQSRPYCVRNHSELKLDQHKDEVDRDAAFERCEAATLIPKMAVPFSKHDKEKAKHRSFTVQGKNQTKRDTQLGKASYSLKISPESKHKQKTGRGIRARVVSACEKPHMHRRNVHTTDVASLGTDSSIESLETLERLFEEQHAQLVARGLLPPDEELALKALEHTTPTETSSSVETLRQLPNITPSVAGGRMSVGLPSESEIKDSEDILLQCSSDDSSSCITALARLAESLEMPISVDVASKPVTDESSEMEKSAAAIAALARYQSQPDAADNKEVIYDVSISKQADQEQR